MEESVMSRIYKVGIVGAGTMGSALAQKFSQEGKNVVLVDTEDDFLERGLEHIKATLTEGVSRGIFIGERVTEIVAQISPTTNLQNLAQCQLVIEAVFEDFNVKKDLFRKLSSIVPADTIVATNTSSFSVTDLSASITRPERFLGLHFFYHAAKNRLVEVVRGKTTDENVFKKVMWFMQRCGKDPIVCRDTHGFVVNRFFVPWLNEAVRIVEEGIAKPAAIDSVACKTFGCGMGPFALMNATGIPIAYHTQKTLEEAFSMFYHPAEALRKQAEKNEPWHIESAEESDPALSEQIANRMLGVVFLVCGQLLDEQVCMAGDINRGARIGLRWRKGPLELFHKYGEHRVRELVDTVADSWNLETPASLSIDNWQPDFIVTAKEESTGIITINRPEDLNAMNPVVFSQLADVFETQNSDDSIDTILISGQGKAFVAGADIKFFIDHIQKNTISEIVDFTVAGQELFQRIDDSHKTVVAIVNGLALGGGLELALSTDIIVSLEKAMFAFPETGIGIYPGLGGTQRTVSRIGKGLTKYLVYTGQMLDARTAKEIGLVDKIVTWDELFDVMKNLKDMTRSPVQLSDKWRQVEEFFNTYTVEQFLGEDEFPEAWLPIVKKIRYKAPRALQLAELLINEHQGPKSELRYIEEIFRTKDALAGLQSVGGKPAKFKGY